MQLHAIPQNPVPNGGVSGSFQGYDGAELRFAHWPATRGGRQGTVCIFPGRTEFIERYFEVIGDLRRRGFAVAIFDLRGQGSSVRPIGDPYKGHITDFSEYDRDVTCFMRSVVLPDCPPPYVALGHSLGGNVVLRNLVTQSNWFDRAVLTAPMVKLHPHILGHSEGVVRRVIRTIRFFGGGRRYVPGGSARPRHEESFENNLLTSDRERYRRDRLMEDAFPHLLLGSPTVAWLDAAFRSIQMINTPEFISKVRVPTLIFAAGQDKIVEPQAVEDYGTRLKLGMSIRFRAARHEIMQETDDIRSRFWAAFDAYIGGENAEDETVETGARSGAEAIKVPLTLAEMSDASGTLRGPKGEIK